jgi:hypothetical protein
MSFAGCESKLYRQAIGVHDSMDLARQPASRPSHVLFSVVRDAGFMLVHMRRTCRALGTLKPEEPRSTRGVIVLRLSRMAGLSEIPHSTDSTQH